MVYAVFVHFEQNYTVMPCIYRCMCIRIYAVFIRWTSGSMYLIPLPTGSSESLDGWFSELHYDALASKSNRI